MLKFIYNVRIAGHFYMYFMSNKKEEPAISTNDKDAPAINEKKEPLSLKERMKQKLQAVLNKKSTIPEENAELDLLMVVLAKDKSPEDDVFEGQYGNYTMGEGFVGGDIFQPGTDNGSDANINGLLEMTVMAKACMGNDESYFGGSEGNAEQMMMVGYAAQLTGLNLVNAPKNIELSPEIKQKMDQAWAAMSKNLGINPEQDLEKEAAQEVSNGYLIGHPDGFNPIKI